MTKALFFFPIRSIPKFERLFSFQLATRQHCPGLINAHGASNTIIIMTALYEQCLQNPRNPVELNLNF